MTSLEVFRRKTAERMGETLVAMTPTRNVSRPSTKKKRIAMFVIIVSFGPQATQWDFRFKTKEAAMKAYDNIWIHDYEITDDFGSKAAFSPESIHGVSVHKATGA